MKQRIGALILTLIMLTFAACGGSNAPGQGASPTPVASESQATDAPQQPAGEADAITQLQFYTWWSDGEKALGEAVVADYEAANPDIDIFENYLPYSEYHTKLNSMIAAGSAPDVYFINEYLVNEWGENGTGMDLLPLYIDAGMDPKELYFDVARFETGDNLWGVSFSLGTVILYYNKDMLAAAGIAAPSLSATNPWTWAEYAAAAKAMTKDSAGLTPNDSGFNPDAIDVYGTIFTNNITRLGALLTTNNSSFANQDGTALNVTKPEGIQVLQAIADLSFVDHSAPNLEVQKGSYADQDCPMMLMNNQLGMYIDGAWMLPTFANEDYDVGMAQLPKFSKANNAVYGSAFQIASTTPNKDQAFAFYTYLLNHDNAVSAAKSHNVAIGNLPGTRSTVEDPEKSAAWKEIFNPDLAELATGILNDASVIGECTYIKGYAELTEQLLQPQMDKIWLGEVSAEEAMSVLDSQAGSYLKGAW